jgi:hypothetical protein
MALGGGFRRLWVATVASNLGDGLVLAAFPLLAASVSRSPKAVAGLAVAAGLPWLAFGPFAGAIVDRIDRLRLMIGFDAGRAAWLEDSRSQCSPARARSLPCTRWCS